MLGLAGYRLSETKGFGLAKTTP